MGFYVEPLTSSCLANVHPVHIFPWCVLTLVWLGYILGSMMNQNNLTRTHDSDFSEHDEKSTSGGIEG